MRIKTWKEREKEALSDVDMEVEDEGEEAEEGEEDEGVKENGGGAGFKISELNELFSAMDLNHQPWR